MTYPEQKYNHEEEMRSLLPSQFSNSPNIAALLSIYSAQVQELEDEYFRLLGSLGLDTANNYALDLIGKELGELRQGKNDTEYRAALITRNFINNSSGTPEEVIAATMQITGATSVKYSEQYPAGVVLEIDGVDYTSKASVIRKTVPAAVDLNFLEHIEDSDVQAFGAAVYSYVRNIESNFKYLDLVEDGTMQRYGFLSTETRLNT